MNQQSNSTYDTAGFQGSQDDASTLDLGGATAPVTFTHVVQATFKISIPCDKDLEDQAGIVVKAKSIMAEITRQLGGKVEVKSPFVPKRLKK